MRLVNVDDVIKAVDRHSDGEKLDDDISIILEEVPTIEARSVSYGEERRKKGEEMVSDLIYDYVDYMYCDNCRFNYELMEESESACEDCHRKYNGWGISHHTAEAISEKIFELLQKL